MPRSCFSNRIASDRKAATVRTETHQRVWSAIMKNGFGEAGPADQNRPGASKRRVKAEQNRGIVRSKKASRDWPSEGIFSAFWHAVTCVLLADRILTRE